MIGRRAGLSCTLVLACLPSLGLGAIPGSSSSLLPLGTDLGDEAFDRPREVFRSETAGGHKSYMVVLGDVAFSSPKLLGGAARQAGISCGTCHVNGAANSLFYIPGLSTRHGNFDTTSPTSSCAGCHQPAGRAPRTSRVRRYASPRLVMCPKRALPPVEYCRGTRPSQAANCRALVNRPISTTVAATSDAVIGPIPGIVARRR